MNDVRIYVFVRILRRIHRPFFKYVPIRIARFTDALLAVKQVLVYGYGSGLSSDPGLSL